MYPVYDHITYAQPQPAMHSAIAAKTTDCTMRMKNNAVLKNVYEDLGNALNYCMSSKFGAMCPNFTPLHTS